MNDILGKSFCKSTVFIGRNDAFKTSLCLGREAKLHCHAVALLTIAGRIVLFPLPGQGIYEGRIA